MTTVAGALPQVFGRIDTTQCRDEGSFEWDAYNSHAYICNFHGRFLSLFYEIYISIIVLARVMIVQKLLAGSGIYRVWMRK